MIYLLSHKIFVTFFIGQHRPSGFLPFWLIHRRNTVDYMKFRGSYKTDNLWKQNHRCLFLYLNQRNTDTAITHQMSISFIFSYRNHHQQHLRRHYRKTSSLASQLPRLLNLILLSISCPKLILYIHLQLQNWYWSSITNSISASNPTTVTQERQHRHPPPLHHRWCNNEV